MIDIARQTDIAVGICRNHKTPRRVVGIIASGDQTAVTQGLSTAVVGDIVIFNCGHIGIIASGTTVCDIRGIPIALVGSLVVGQVIGVVITGAGNVTAN